MSEPEHSRGEKAWASKGDRYAEKGVKRRCTKSCSGLERSVSDGLKGVLDRLHHKRERIQHRTHYETSKRKG